MYQKQPDQLLNGDYQHEIHGLRIFQKLMRQVDPLGADWYEDVFPIAKFWVRQALTIVHVWNMHLSSEVHQMEGHADVMPPYSWCVAVYEKMRGRFMNSLRDSFSDYPYNLRVNVLRKLDFMDVFEECWGWVCETCSTTYADRFVFFEVHVKVYRAIIDKVRDLFRNELRDNARFREAFDAAFESTNVRENYWLLTELPEINSYELQFELQE
jgi:hypothetical protein